MASRSSLRRCSGVDIARLQPLCYVEIGQHHSLFAALTMASLDCPAMLPSAISTVSGGRLNAIKSCGLTVPREDVIRQREQRVACRAGRKRVELLLRPVREFDSAPIRVIDRRVIREALEQF